MVDKAKSMFPENNEIFSASPLLHWSRYLALSIELPCTRHVRDETELLVADLLISDVLEW